MYQNEGIKEGMTVRSIDGHKLGKVYSVGEREFFIEKGIFFPKDYAVRYGEVSSIRDGVIILAHGEDSLRSFSDALVFNASGLASTRERTAGLSSDDLGMQVEGPYNTEGASASPILTEEDRAMRRTEVGFPLGQSYGQAVAQRPMMHASDDAMLPGRSVHTVDEDFDEALRMNQAADDYPEALRMNQAADDYVEALRMNQRRDEELGSRQFVFRSDDQDGNTRF